jgi:glucose-6-phosphate isomerase
MEYKNFDKLSAYNVLKEEAKKFTVSLGDDLKVNEKDVGIGAGLRFNYAARPVNTMVVDMLQALVDEADVIAKYREILDGKVMNTGEDRKVLHHLIRGQLGQNVENEGKVLRDFYIEQQNKTKEFAKKVQNGEILGSTGKQFNTVVQIGIGGSDLGPRAFYLALKNYVNDKKGRLLLDAKFISNVDSDDANDVLGEVDYETTLFVLVSKSGTTQETLTNEAFVMDSLKSVEGIDPSKHMVVVTSETSPLAKSDDYLAAIYIDDFIGGRYSVTSAVGGVVLSLSLGFDVFKEILEGANEVDENSLKTDIRENGTLLDAAIGVWERNFLNYPVTAILPYSQALSRFPAHLQQLDMESNGKSVNRDGQLINYLTGPIIFGEPGTNGQHSFYQLLHQGTDPIPLQFVGFKKSQYKKDIEAFGSISQDKLNANLVAQIVAFAKGKKDINKNKEFAGNRPSSLIYGEQLTPRALGGLLAHYENKVMFQGLIWNINSFDQEGVQLGKVLAKEVLQKSDDLDADLLAYSKILDIGA